MSQQQPEVLVYPRHAEGLRGAVIDNSSVIARFMVGQEFVDRTSDERTSYRITRIDREGIWGLPTEGEEQRA